jgi:hypothetical protein
MPALSSSPGQAPTHEERHFSEGKVAAVGPTSAMICCAESTPRPGTSASRSTASWCWLSRLAISLSSSPICSSINRNSCRHLQHPPVDGVQLGTGAERVAQLFRRGAQAHISQSGHSRWVGFPVSERLQHPQGTETQQIGDEAGQLDMLICVSSRRDSNWFCSRTRSHLNWYFLRVTVRHKRCGYFNQARGLSPLPQGEDNDAQFAQSRALRIRQGDSLEFSSVAPTSPL